MSIYSGFATRKQEEKYNKLLSRLIDTLQAHILVLTNGKIDFKFYREYQQLIFKISTMQEHKYLPPKFSEQLEPFMQAVSESKPVKMKSERAQSRSTEKTFGLEAVKEEDEFEQSQIKEFYRDKSKKKLSSPKNNKKKQRQKLESIQLKPRSQKRSQSTIQESQVKKITDLDWKKTVERSLLLHSAELKLRKVNKIKKIKKPTSSSFQYLQENGFSNPFNHNLKTELPQDFVYR